MVRVGEFGKLRGVVLVAGLMAALPSVAEAQGPGVRAGVSTGPDQVYVGGHYESGALADRLHFKPNAEIGVGDDLTTVALNFEFVYKVPIDGPWSFYAGGGPAINIYSFDTGFDDESETEGGLNFLVGLETTRGLFFEAKFGAIDSPDFKFGVGYTWR